MQHISQHGPLTCLKESGSLKVWVIDACISSLTHTHAHTQIVFCPCWIFNRLVDKLVSSVGHSRRSMGNLFYLDLCFRFKDPFSRFLPLQCQCKRLGRVYECVCVRVREWHSECMYVWERHSECMYKCMCSCIGEMHS